LPNTILVADDEADIVSLTKAILEREGYRVVTASNGLEALQMVETERPDLVLLDVVMPAKSGLEVCRTLKAQAKTRHIPIVMFTVVSSVLKARADPLLKTDSGCDGYFAKPFTPLQLLTEIRKHLRQQGDIESSPATAAELEAAKDTHMIQGISRDVTQRMRAEEDLRESEEKYRRIYTSSFDAIYTTTLDGRFLDMNPAGVSMLGYDSLDELKKARIDSIYVDLDDRKRLIQLANKGFVRGFETRFRRKDGRILNVMVNAYPIMDEKGRITALQGATVDITGRKQVENMKDRFISAVTHELRTPLVSIKGYLDLILEGKLGTVPKEIRSSLEVVKRNAGRLTQLTDDLLDLRRLESGSFQLNPEPVSLRTILSDCISEIVPFLNEKEQRLHVDMVTGPIWIHADPLRLTQALANLLSNACKFAPKHGEIKIKVNEEAEKIRIQISDNGIGIRKEDLDRVFQPFAAIQKPSHVKGTGLGLGLTKGLVEAHGGRIWAESAGEGKGSTFTFTLPKKAEAMYLGRTNSRG